MSRNIFTTLIALFITSFVFAQVSTTPEVPRNYKPKPKTLLPMPDSLTSAKIFPVLGKYAVVSKSGDTTNVYITLDAKSKGVIWVNGLPEGKFKADLKASPATYSIPSQKTFLNDAVVEEETVSDAAATENTAKPTPSKKLSGKFVDGGTLIFDKDANQLYINLGSKFNEKDPALIFEGLKNAEIVTEDSSTSAKKAKKAVSKGKNYTGSKVSIAAAVSN